MTVPAGIAIVVSIVQFAKKVLPNIVKDAIALIITILASLGVAVYKTLSEGGAFTFQTIVFFVEVLVGAMGAYSLAKVASGV
jgi:hypothetical protein